MKTSFEYSVLIFSPLLIALLLPPFLYLPAGMLIILISVFESTVSMSEAAINFALIISPVILATALVLAGMGLHSSRLREKFPKASWATVWALFSIALYFASWCGLITLTAIGASDYSTGSFLILTARAAAVATLILQPGVVVWLYSVTRIQNRKITLQTKG